MPWGKHRKVQSFFVAIGKEVTNIYKDGNERVVIISYKKVFFDSAKEIHKVKFKDCHCFLEYESVSKI